MTDASLERKLEALRKVLRLERERGFSDEAVLGGMDLLLERWAEDPEVRPYLSPIGEAVPTYRSQGQEERAGWVEWALGGLEDAEATPPVEPAPARRARSRRPDATSYTPTSPDTSLPVLPTGGKEALTRLARLGVRTYRDALLHFPHRHNDFSQRVSVVELVGGVEQTVHVTVIRAVRRTLGGRRGATEAVVGDETGSLRAVWFGQPYLARSFQPGVRLALSGRVGLFRGRPVFESPEYEILRGADTTHTGRLVPVYPSTEGLPQRTVRRIVRAALDRALPLIEEALPQELLRRTGLMGQAEAIRQFHYPDDAEKRDRARRRLAFEELLLLQLGVLDRRRAWREEATGLPMRVDHPVLQHFRDLLPFALTAAQEKALSEVLGDMARPRAMSRLLQGEVGSGKTAVAVAALLVTAASGYQGAFMAPTEVLATQHFQTISRILGQAAQKPEPQAPYRGFGGLLDRPLRVALVVGSQPRREKIAVRRLIQRGDVDIVVGTQALIQREGDFADLGLVVVDEQHRFGVEQRAALREKGNHPHLLAMTATPIPRTLALTLYGDLDLSLIGELPPGRPKIRTRVLSSDERGRAYRFIRDQVAEGRQAFIIYPLVEESEAVQTRAAVAEYDRLSAEVFPDQRLGLLHGRMKTKEKEETMARFRDGAVDVLVSTPVVEVGIDVPNATVMLVDGAERFGLAQLHQYRGRVGRGEYPSFCIAVSDSRAPEVRRRLATLERTRDGFELAEEDLRLRGPGEFFGTRQSGVLDLKMARLSDVPLLELAREEALGLFREDPMLEAAEHAPLREAVARFWAGAQEAPAGATEA